MRDFATLLERLSCTPAHEPRLAWIGRYLATAPDPDRGFGLALLAGSLRLPALGPGVLRRLVAARTDPLLFALSQDYAGDLAETTALLWPAPPDPPDPPRLAEVVEALQTTPRTGLPDLLAGWLDRAAVPERRALLSLLTGGPRAEISGPLARQALAAWGGLDPAAVDAVWHGLAPPYAPLFAWAAGRAPRPDPGDAPLFRPLIQPQPIAAAEVAALDPASVRAGWAWDGLRVQLVATQGGRRIFSHQADDLSAAFPELLAALDDHVVLDGELLALSAPPPAPGTALGAPAPVAALHRRLNRLAPSAALRRDCPVGVRLSDLLVEGTEDLRPLPFEARRARLEAWYALVAPAAMDLSPLLDVADAAGLARLRAAAPPGSAGLLLKRRDSPYRPGPPAGAWRHWAPDPRRIDAVLLYAEPGPGAAGGVSAVYTVGLWDGDALVPVGKADARLAEAERRWLDDWIRAHTIARFGPVREVEKALVLEVTYASAHAAPRRRAGVALRCPRITALRQGRPADAADRLDAVLGPAGSGVAAGEAG